jgi:DNA polymerase elongation subunit (family B)
MEHKCSHKCSQDCKFEHDRTKEHLLHHVKAKIPTNLTFADRVLLPKRRDILSLINNDALIETEQTIKKREPIIFMPNDICEPMIYEYGSKVYKPYLIGILPCGSKATVILNNVKVYFDVKLPDFPALDAIEPLLKSKKNDNFIDLIKAGAFEGNINILDDEIIQLLPADGFRLTTHPYVRFFFKNLDDRSKAYKMVKTLSLDCITASDDETPFNRVSYLSKVAREHKFSTADWNYIEKYSVVSGKTNCEYTFNVDVNDFKPLSNAIKSTLSKEKIKLLDFDNAIMAQWDIETDGELPDVRPLTPDSYVSKHFDTSKFVIFMMNTSFYQQWNTDALYEVCVLDSNLNIDRAKSKAGNEKNTLISIVCDTEKQILIANMYVWSLIQPEFLGGFNTAAFDWPVYREKLYNLDLLGDLKKSLHTIIEGDNRYKNEDVYKYCFVYNKKIKLTAERDHYMICSAKFAGVIDSDGMPNFLKLYPRAEISKVAGLNFFLKANGLEGKEDMPYKKMFKIHERSRQLKHAKGACHCSSIHLLTDFSQSINELNCECCQSTFPEIDCIENEEYDYDDPRRYTTKPHDDIACKCCFCGKRERNLADMELVAIYCRIDCQRPQELNVKRAIIGDKRELANLSYVPLYNAFIYADGEKVKNMLGAYCYDYGVAFSNITIKKSESEKDWNVGGFVVTPKRGIYRVPITGLDFESLYPSLIAAYNLSPDMIINNAEFAKKLMELGYTLYPITDESETHLTFNRGEKKNDPSNEVFNNIAWSVRHNGILTAEDKNIVIGYDEKYKPIYGREALPQERLGYMAHIVKSLKELRRPIKAKFLEYDKQKQEIEKEIASFNMEAKKETNQEALKELEIKHKEAVFFLNKYNSKSNSVKVLNNTFYGQVSQYRNSFYNINIAGGITSAGRKNLKMVKKFVESKGFFIAYGDTDSLYIACPLKVYDDIPYPKRTEAYYTNMVEIAMKTMKELQEEVFAMLVRDNGTLFLRMVYEEVGLFTVMCGKKKYYMIPHADEINFRPKEIFIRGLELKKQGQTLMSKELQMEFLWTSLNIEHERELIDIAVDIVKLYFTREQDLTKFAKMHTYRPNKKNISVLKFVERMRQQGKFIPDAGDKFKTVVIRRDQSYTERGTMIKPSVGDKMEYLFEAQKNGYKLDMIHYLEAGIYGPFARFIAYHPRFQMEGLNMEDPIEYKRGDEYSVKQATLFLKQVCAEYINASLDIMSPSQRGRQLQREYKLSVKALTSNNSYNKNVSQLLAKKTVAGVVPSSSESSHPALFVEKLRENIKKSHSRQFAELFVNKHSDNIFELKKRFDKDYKTRFISFTKLENATTQQLLKMLPESWTISDNYNNRISEGIKLAQEGVAVLVALTDAEQDKLNEVSLLLAKYQAIIFCKMNMMAIIGLICDMVIKKTEIDYVPRINARDFAKEECKKASVISEYIFS